MDQSNLPITIFGILSSGSVLTFAGLLVKGWLDRRKVSREAQKLGAENVQILTSTNISQLEYMRKELEEMQKDMEAVKAELKKAQEAATHIRITLRKYIVEMKNYRELTEEEWRTISGY